MVIGTFFQKKFLSRLKSSDVYQCLCAGFLPALILFSFSGHTKLARYIAYVFPFVIMILAHSILEFDIHCKKYRQKCTKLNLSFGFIFLLLLILQIFQFSTESQASIAFIVNVIVFVFALIGYSFWLVNNRYDYFSQKPFRLLTTFGLIYIMFFTVLSIQTPHTPFLNYVKHRLLDTL